MKHTIIKSLGEAYPYTCTVCGDIWKREPRSSCPGVLLYHWKQAPAHLQTYSQLRSRHLKPRDRLVPDGCLAGREDWIWLYDKRQALPRRPYTDRQRQAFQAAWPRTQEKSTCQRCGEKPQHLADLRRFKGGYCEDCLEELQDERKQIAFENKLLGDRFDAILWARDLLARTDWAIIDTETTDLSGVAVEIAAVAPDGQVLFESLVNPEDWPVSPEARHIHQISETDLATAPTLSEIWPRLVEALAGRTLLLSYNAAFDRAILERHATSCHLPPLAQSWDCIMLWYAQFCGDWSHYWGSYKWQPLWGGNHRASGDALAALEVLKAMSAADLEDEVESEQKDRQL